MIYILQAVTCLGVYIMTKDYYRQEILRIKPYINLSAICDAIGISRTPMFYFLRGIDSALSYETLQKFMDFVDSL